MQPKAPNEGSILNVPSLRNLNPTAASIDQMSEPESSLPARTEEDAEDVRLMGLVSAGEPSAFEQLVERHQRLVVGTVSRMLGNNADA